MRPSSLYLPESNQELGESLDELLVSKSRWLIVITNVFFILMTIITTSTAPTRLIAVLFGLVIAFGLLSIAVYRNLETRYLIGHIAWQVGLTLMIVAASLAFGNSEVLLLAALLPLIGAITLGWGAGLIAELVVIGLVAAAQSAVLLNPLPEIIARIIPIFGVFGGLLGWVTTNHLMTSAAWALYNFTQARDSLNEAREQRVELTQTQEDLSQAYQELARLTDRLKSLQHIAEEARQAKAEFVANVSHELRTPLNMIIGFTEVITRTPGLYGGRLPSSLMTDITAIQRNSRHLLNLVNDVLDLSQVDGGRMALSRDWANLNTIASEAVTIVSSLFQSKGLYLKLEASQNLPQVYCDQTRIRQVIINLLSNAGRFTTAGGVTITISEAGSSLQVGVRDTGPGIPPDDQTRIFEPFTQLDNSIRRQYGGSGLGLTISKQFIEMHGGKMWLESQPGQGTTFYFSLPVEPELVEEGKPARQPVRRSIIPGDEFGFSLRTRPSRAVVPVPTRRLVVCEKEHALQRVLSRYMTDTEVVAVQTLPEAAAEMNRSPAQALVINTPPNEALTAEALAITPFGTPVITCWLPGEVEAADQLGVIQYLMKPITREKLLDVLEEFPKKYPLRGELKCLLVVDDEPDELHLFARMLESSERGYQVLQANNGQRALDMLRSRSIDLVLLDLIMPVMNGFQVIEEKVKEPAIRDVPVIVISSRDPLSTALTSNSIQISHNGGFTTSHLLEIIQTATEIILEEQFAKDSA